MNILGQIKEVLISYFDVYTKLFKLNFIQRTSNVLSYIMFAMIVMFLMFCIILFIGFGLSELFVEMGTSRMAAHFLVTGIYVLLFATMIASRKGITRLFSNSIIKTMTEGPEKEAAESNEPE